MHNVKHLLLSLALVATPFTAACGDDGGRADESTGAGPTAPMTDPGTSSEPTGTTVTPTSEPETTNTPTSNPPTTTTDPATTTTGDPTTEDPSGFVFDETPPGELVQLDRMGMPAVATAVISAELKDAYNEADPAVDAGGMFVDDIVKNVTGLHTALDDDLMGAMLVPCAAMTCVNQAAPLVVPDTLQIDTSKPAGFPNGRMLADPVVDITLAVVMLDLGVAGQSAASLVGTNPKANDKEFLPDFPYVAPPHE